MKENREARGKGRGLVTKRKTEREGRRGGRHGERDRRREGEIKRGREGDRKRKQRQVDPSISWSSVRKF